MLSDEDNLPASTQFITSGSGSHYLPVSPTVLVTFPTKQLLFASNALENIAYKFSKDNVIYTENGWLEEQNNCQK